MMNKQQKIRKVLFVCRGNTCRSPMAEYLFREICQKNKLEVEIASCGLYNQGATNYAGYYPTIKKMSREAINAVNDFDPNIRGMEFHTSKSITREDIASSDLILAMEECIRDEVISIGLAFDSNTEEILEKKVFALKEYVGKTDSCDVEDPVNTGFIWGGLESYLGLGISNLNGYFFDNKKAFAEYVQCRDEILQCLNKIVVYFKHPILSKLKRVPLKETLRKRNERRAKRKEELAATFNKYAQPYNGGLEPARSRAPLALLPAAPSTEEDKIQEEEELWGILK